METERHNLTVEPNNGTSWLSQHWSPWIGNPIEPDTEVPNGSAPWSRTMGAPVGFPHCCPTLEQDPNCAIYCVVSCCTNCGLGSALPTVEPYSGSTTLESHNGDPHWGSHTAAPHPSKTHTVLFTV